MAINKNYVVKLVWFFITTIAILLGSYWPDFNKTVLIMAILTNVMIVFALRRVQPAMIFAIFALSYVLYLIPYYFFGSTISGHIQYYQPGLYNKVLGIHTFFLSALYLAINPDINKDRLLIRDMVKARENKAIFLLMVCFMMVIMLTIKGGSVLDSSSSYETYTDNLDKQSGGIEYFYIFYICGYYFTQSAKLRNILLFLAIVYCYFCVTRGYRIQVVQMIALTFTLFLDGKIKTKYVLFLALLGFAFSEMLGVMKNTGTVSIEELLKLYDRSDGLIITNQTDVFYSSVVFVGLVQDGILSLPMRVWSALGFLLNCIVPSSFVWKAGRLPSFAADYTTLGGGGLVSVYFFIWFGYVGTIGIAVAFARFLSTIYKNNSKPLFKVIGILLLATFPRWLVYDPGNFLFRLPIYLLAFFYLLVVVHNTLLKHSGKLSGLKRDNRNNA